MTTTLEQFIERLTQSGLMSAAEFSAFQNKLPPEQRPRDVQALVTVLYRAGKITKYQAAAIYEGKGHSLVFDEYVVLDQIGEGGMGVVLKAQHRRMKRLVAVKMLLAARLQSPEAVERFYREVQAAAKLSHPNIVASYDAREQDGTLCLVMEYVEGSDLAVVVKEHGPLPIPQAVNCILQAARALQYAHGKGIVHRDIKPGNLLLDKEGTVKILDMGLARITGVEAAMGGPEQLTVSGQVMGTCDYMAPEQAFDSHKADHRADIYSLGCTLYRLLTGNPPYGGETLVKILMAHRENPIPSLCVARPEVPEELDECFQKMMAKTPEDRYQSMAEVATSLEAVLAVLAGQPASVATPAESSSEAYAKNWAFLQEASLPHVLPGRKKSHAAERTLPNDRSEQDTGANLAGKAMATVARVGCKPLVLVGLAGSAVALLLGIVLALSLRKGTLVVEIDEQLGKNVQVAVSQGGQEVRRVDAKSGRNLSLSPGRYDLAVQGGDGPLQLDSEHVTVTRGVPVKVRVTRKTAPLAAVPVGAKPAQTNQEIAGAKPASQSSAAEKPKAEETAKTAPTPGKPADANPSLKESVAETPKTEETAKTAPTSDKPADANPSLKESVAEKPKSDAEEAPAEKFDPPSADEQKRLIGEVDEVYKPGEAKDQAAKAALTFNLLEAGRKNKSNRAEQFVLLRRAGEIACSACEPDLMLEAVDAITAAGFTIPPYQVKSRFLKRLLEQDTLGSADQLSTVSAACIRFAEDAAANGAIDEAFDVLAAAGKSLAEPSKRALAACRTAQAAVNHARNLAEKAEREKKVRDTQGDLDTIKSAQSALADCGKGLQQARHEYEAIQTSQEQLKTHPDDPDACLTVGRWCCFSRGDWDEGLKLLAKGSDVALKTLAAEELASKPAQAEEKVARGDAWWGLAEKATGKAKAAMRRRAVHWYQEAMPDLAAGLVKSRVDNRLAQSPLEGDGKSTRYRPPLAISPFNEKTAKQHQDRWVKYLHVPVVQTNSIGMKLVLIPPGEFDMGSPKEMIERNTDDQRYMEYSPGEGPRHRVRITKPY